MQKNRKLIKSITTTSMIIAIGIVIGIFCKNYLNLGNGAFRITFDNLPTILAGILYGPVIGGVVGLTTDLVSYFMSSQAYPIMPLVTVGASMVGVVAGVISKYVVKKKGIKQIIISGALAHVVGSMIIKSIGLFSIYNVLVFVRIPLYLVVATIEIILLCILLKRKSFAKIVGYIDEGKKRMTYSQALEYIHSINWTFCKPGLERTEELCKGLNNPQNNLKFIHVAGTNGKGSFSSMLSSVLTEAGYRVGLYTSPYITYFNERMAINGVPISNDELVLVTEKVKKVADKMTDKPTEFELVTAIAFEYFNRNKCDYVVLECGLGGRLDSTNVISTSVLSVITGISLDHTAILGNTVEEIAREKAGIIKENVPVLWCGKDENAKNEIENAAKNRHAPLYFVNHEEINIKEMTLEGTTLDFHPYSEIKIKLLGSYQPLNCANVLSAVKILKENGVQISDENVKSGLLKAKWSARFEIISQNPLVIFDGAHNPEGVCASVASVENYFENERLLVLTGVMADKDYNYIANQISKIADEVFCITPDNPRALNAEEYASVFSSLNVKANGYKTVKEAVECAILKAKTEKKALVCLGSLYMYGEILKEINILEK